MAIGLADSQILEGTWEELQQHAAELSGHMIQIRILDSIAPISKYTPEFWAEKMAALDTRVKDARPMTDAESAESWERAAKRQGLPVAETREQVEDLIAEALDAPAYLVTDQYWARMRQDLRDRVELKQRSNEQAA